MLVAMRGTCYNISNNLEEGENYLKYTKYEKNHTGTFLC